MDKQAITGNGGASYTLSHSVANAQEIEVFVNNVRQEPGVAYTVSGTALTMTGNVASTDDFYVIYQGKALQTVVPPDGSVTTAKLAATIAPTNLETTSSTFKMTDLTSNAFYRTGTWTPILSSNNATDTSLSVINQTNSIEQGHYVRIGDIVHCNFYLVLPSVSFSFTNGASGTDSAKIRNLPFNIQNLTDYYPVASCGYFANWTGWTASYTPMGYLTPVSQALNLTHAVAAGTSNIQLASIGFQGAAMIYSFTYKTDDA